MTEAEAGSMRPADPGRYARPVVVLHWMLALLLSAIVALALTADHLPDDWVRPAIDTHKSLGMVALVLVVMKLLCRATSPSPSALASSGRWQRIAAGAAHALLIVLVLSLPISGLLRDSAWQGAALYPHSFFGLFEWPRIGPIASMNPVAKEALHEQLSLIHTTLSHVFYGMVGLHVLAALKHQWIDGERIFRRMWL